MTTTTFTIDCRTCPARGRLCGDCFVPVLGRTWLQPPATVPRPEAQTEAQRHVPHAADPALPTGHRPDGPMGMALLDTDELAAVSAFVRAGLVTTDEAARARAELTAGARSAAG